MDAVDLEVIDERDEDRDEDDHRRNRLEDGPQNEEEDHDQAEKDPLVVRDRQDCRREVLRHLIECDEPAHDRRHADDHHHGGGQQGRIDEGGPQSFPRQ